MGRVPTPNFVWTIYYFINKKKRKEKKEKREGYTSQISIFQVGVQSLI